MNAGFFCLSFCLAIGISMSGLVDGLSFLEPFF